MNTDSNLKKSHELFRSTCYSYGVFFEIESDNVSCFSFLKESLPINVSLTEKSQESLNQMVFRLVLQKGSWSFYYNEEKIWANNERRAVKTLIESFIRLKVAEFSPSYTFVHSGVVMFREHLVLLPANSRDGKSTLVKHLLENGGEYLSDEYALIDDDGKVLSYPKPLSLRVSPDGLQTDYELSELGFKVFNGDVCKPSFVLFTSFQEGSIWNPTFLNVGESVLGLLAHTVSARSQPQNAMRRLAKAVAGSTCVKSPRNNCEIVAKWLVNRLN